MTPQEAFEKKRPSLEKALAAAMLKSAQEDPEGFLTWLGMSVTPKAIAALRKSQVRDKEIIIHDVEVKTVSGETMLGAVAKRNDRTLTIVGNRAEVNRTVAYLEAVPGLVEAAQWFCMGVSALLRETLNNPKISIRKHAVANVLKNVRKKLKPFETEE